MTHPTSRDARPGRQLKAASKAVLLCVHQHGLASQSVIYAALDAAGDTRPPGRKSTTLSNLHCMGYLARKNVNGKPHYLLTELGERAVAPAQQEVELSARQRRRARQTEGERGAAAPAVAAIAEQAVEAFADEGLGQWARYGRGQVRLPPAWARSVFDLGAAL